MVCISPRGLSPPPSGGVRGGRRSPPKKTCATAWHESCRTVAHIKVSEALSDFRRGIAMLLCFNELKGCIVPNPNLSPVNGCFRWQIYTSILKRFWKIRFFYILCTYRAIDSLSIITKDRKSRASQHAFSIAEIHHTTSGNESRLSISSAQSQKNNSIIRIFELQFVSLR